MKGMREGRTWHIYLSPEEAGTLQGLQKHVADLEFHGFRVYAVEFTPEGAAHIVCEYDEAFHSAVIGDSFALW